MYFANSALDHGGDKECHWKNM